MEFETLDAQHKKGIPFSYLPVGNQQSSAPQNNQRTTQFPNSMAFNEDKDDYMNPEGFVQKNYGNANQKIIPKGEDNKRFQPPTSHQNKVEQTIADNDTTYFNYQQIKEAEAIQEDFYLNAQTKPNPVNKIAPASSSQPYQLSTKPSIISHEPDETYPEEDIYPKRLQNSSKSKKGGNVCSGKCCAIFLGVLLLVLMCFGGGFIAGWFGHESYLKSSSTTTVITKAFTVSLVNTVANSQPFITTPLYTTYTSLLSSSEISSSTISTRTPSSAV